MPSRRLAVTSTLLLALTLLGTRTAWAQGDEIQVYDGGLADRGVFNLTWHNNFTPSGLKTPASPDVVTSHRSFNGVTEWAYGASKWLELGLYLPLYSHDQRLGWRVDGFKGRALIATPGADDRTFFYGLGFELSYNAKVWDPTRRTSEFRPIIGWHLDTVDVIFNPILDTAYDGLKNLVFAPSMRVAYNKNDQWAYAIEEYSEYGPLRKFNPAGDQSHQIYFVIDHTGKLFDLQVGAGAGLTDGSDKFVLKAIWSKDLNPRAPTSARAR
jgi:hypothetical protein